MAPGMQLRRRQYLYSCTSKASKLMTWLIIVGSLLGVSICTFVPVKQVKRITWLVLVESLLSFNAAPQASVSVLLY